MPRGVFRVYCYHTLIPGTTQISIINNYDNTRYDYRCV